MADQSLGIQDARSAFSFKLRALLAYLAAVALVFAIALLTNGEGSSPTASEPNVGTSVTTGPSTISPGQLAVNSVTIFAYGEQRGSDAGVRALAGANVEISCGVYDRDNKVVPGPECTWTIVRQPGTDAFLTLNSKGDDRTVPLANLFTGGKLGLIVVSVEAYGHVDQTVVEVVDNLRPG